MRCFRCGDGVGVWCLKCGDGISVVILMGMEMQWLCLCDRCSGVSVVGVKMQLLWTCSVRGDAGRD